MSESLQTAPAAFAPHAVVPGENACISLAVICSFTHLLVRLQCWSQASIPQDPVWRLVTIAEMRWQVGSSTASCKSSCHKAEEVRCRSPEWNCFQSVNPTFHSSSAANVSLSSRRSLIASCLISSSARFPFIQLQRSDWPLIITYHFSPLSLSGIESYPFFFPFFFLFLLFRDYHKSPLNADLLFQTCWQPHSRSFSIISCSPPLLPSSNF